MSDAVASRFVGRTEELELLRGRLAGADDGRGRVVFLSAEAGAGKSTLVDRFLSEVPERVPEAMVIRAGCSEQYGAGEPYQPFVEAFRHLTREQEGRKGRSLKELAKEIAPFWVAAIPVAGEAIAAGMATASELRRTFKGGGGQTAPGEEALFFQYTQLFLAASDEHPLVLFIDDLHWADRSTVSLLTHLGRQVSDRQVLIIGSYRPVDIDVSEHPMRQARQELERYGVAEEVALGPLDRKALERLIETRTGTPPTRRLLDWLHERGGSNTLFFEELLTWLEHQGFARADRGAFDLVQVPQDIEIPRSAESTIEKRLDRLDEDTRRVLEYASVDGNEFDSVSLARLLDMDEMELEDALEPLVRVHRLVQLKETRDLPNDDFASVYRFSHSLIQSVLHANLRGKRRILLHRKMGQILEEIWGEHAEVMAHKLAIHFEEGRQGGKAFEYAIAAAERAHQVYAHWDALDQLQRALRNAEDDAQRSAAHQLQGDTFLAIGRYEDAVEALDAAIAGAGGDAGRVVPLRHRRLLAQRNQGVRPVDELLEEFEELRLEAHRLGLPGEEVRIMWDLIDLPGTNEAYDVTLAEEALARAAEVDDPWLVARGHKILGVARIFDGAPEAALEELERAGETFEELGDRGHVASCEASLALAHIYLGDYRQAAIRLEKAVEAFDEIVDPNKSSGTRSNLARVLKIQGDYDRAEQVLLEALQIGERLSSPAVMLTPLYNLAELQQEQAEWEAAEGWWRELLAKSRESGYSGEQMVAYCGIGMVRLALGDVEGAREAERQAQALIPPGQTAAGESGQALQRLTARLAAASGEWEGAILMLERLIDEGEGEEPYVLALYQLEAAELLHEVEPERARALAAEAAETFRELGTEPLLHRAETITRGTGNA
jgi:tetratricopeptide (TPR) repeat protein